MTSKNSKLSTKTVQTEFWQWQQNFSVNSCIACFALIKIIIPCKICEVIMQTTSLHLTLPVPKRPDPIEALVYLIINNVLLTDTSKRHVYYIYWTHHVHISKISYTCPNLLFWHSLLTEAVLLQTIAYHFSPHHQPQT